MIQPKRRRRTLQAGRTRSTNQAKRENNSQSEQIESPTEVDEYFSNANPYDGSLRDRTDKNSIEVRVGASENGLAFDPPAVRISPGTEITWAWTGEGSTHNVVSESTSSTQNQNEGKQHSDQEHGHSESKSNSSDRNETESEQNQNESGQHSDNGHDGQGMLRNVTLLHSF
ncbi:plastocyanin/azurin family copper-binding protein [Halalkalicoccus salilacus]|uniref:plastocyanin/azurin family copper-binding protein n=1 Tax=Halalkalicoccus salilacus TaxID=3117459 RepID=UPI00300E8C4F